MYRRFLNNNDYLSAITQDALNQLTRGNNARFSQAEEAAEISIIEYLSENYEIEKELVIGKYIAPHDRQITFPIGAHIYYKGEICEVIRSISGYKQPTTVTYWKEASDTILSENIPLYSQFVTYYPGDIVVYNDTPYVCLAENGYKFINIRIPMVYGWLEKETGIWQPVNYDLWDVTKFEDAFYTLISLEGFDNNVTPLLSDCWGAIADYDPSYNDYELSEHEYVVYEHRVFYPEIDVNADIPQIGVNLALHDPRNYNLKKHMVRLSIYELTKQIAPNNVSVVRMRDYEDSMKWLNDASKLRINPQIPRKLDEVHKPVTDWQLATFQTDYDPHKNPWLT